MADNDQNTVVFRPVIPSKLLGISLERESWLRNDSKGPGNIVKLSFPRILMKIVTV